jgi:hypothetical protein
MKFNNEGRAAFKAGAEPLDSPYSDWERRSQWVKGWYDAQHDALLTPKVIEGPTIQGAAQPSCLRVLAPSQGSSPEGCLDQIMIRYRYRTTALVGAWRSSRRSAFRDALRAGQARRDGSGADGISWAVPGQIETLAT